MKRYATLLVLISFLDSATLLGQLDSIHWIPPMHARVEEGPQYLYLSTPDTATFPVEVRDGAGILLKTLTISNANPQRYDLGANQFTPTLVTEAQLHQALQGKGLVISGPKKFYAYFRAHSGSNYHACDLTCKGRAALGTIFRIGHLVQEVSDTDRRSNFVGVMASEDSTVVRISGYHPSTQFRISEADEQPLSPPTFLLMKGETVVFSNYISDKMSGQPPNGLMGALLEASKPVAVNCGSWVGAPVELQAHDIGIDQIAPLEQVGKEYILCRGNGSSILEHPIVIAHFDNTKVWLNGNTTPSAILNAGEFYVVATNNYSVGGNMYIQCSEPVFLYQMIGGVPFGNDAARTAGLIFVPPVSCAIPNAVDNIYQPNSIGFMKFDGGVMIVAMRDSMVTARLDGVPFSIGNPSSVQGYPDFVTYRKLDLFSQTDDVSSLSVVAEGPVQVAMFGRNNPASFAAFFSGFSKIARPSLELSLVGDGVCPDTLLATGRFDGVQWVYEDSIISYGKDTFFVAFAPGRYTAVGYLGVCRRTDFAADSLVAEFNSPAFKAEFEEPSCFGFSNGQIHISQPYGGFPPYYFSIDKGQNFSQNPHFGHLPKGHFDLVVRDSTGCYNRPMPIEFGQPDSFSVEIVPRLLPVPLKPNMEVQLEGLPARPVIATQWEPSDSTGCKDCLTYAIRPKLDTWVTLTVLDSMGCPATARFLLEVEPNVFAPNILHAGGTISPNDQFTLFSRDPLPVHRLRIFDRWGELVFEKTNFQTNDLAAGWGGNFKGKTCQPGVYLWLAEVEVADGKVVMLRGDLTLLR